MLTSISIKNFRCFEDLTVAPLSRVNLITGRNNTGKTGLLEALAILLAHPNPTACGNLPNLFREGVGQGDFGELFWKWLFHRKQMKQAIELSYETSDQTHLGVAIWNYSDPAAKPQNLGHSVFECGKLWDLGCARSVPGGLPPLPQAVCFSTRPSDPNKDALDFNAIVLKKRKQDIIRLLSAIEPRLVGLESLHTPALSSHSTTPLIFADVGLPEMIPAAHLGQAFTRLLTIYSKILANPAQVLLIDEIENGIHHSVMADIWTGLFHACRELDLQIFATTHSRECIQAAHHAAKKSASYDLGLIRLDRVEEKIVSTVMGESTLDTAEEFNWEMR